MLTRLHEQLSGLKNTLKATEIYVQDLRANKIYNQALIESLDTRLNRRFVSSQELKQYQKTKDKVTKLDKTLEETLKKFAKTVEEIRTCVVKIQTIVYQD